MFNVLCSWRPCSLQLCRGSWQQLCRLCGWSRPAGRPESAECIPAGRARRCSCPSTYLKPASFWGSSAQTGCTLKHIICELYTWFSWEIRFTTHRLIRSGAFSQIVWSLPADDVCNVVVQISPFFIWDFSSLFVLKAGVQSSFSTFETTRSNFWICMISRLYLLLWSTFTHWHRPALNRRQAEIRCWGSCNQINNNIESVFSSSFIYLHLRIHAVLRNNSFMLLLMYKDLKHNDNLYISEKQIQFHLIFSGTLSLTLSCKLSLKTSVKIYSSALFVSHWLHCTETL